jgi:hypothetical protein
MRTLNCRVVLSFMLLSSATPGAHAESPSAMASRLAGECQAKGDSVAYRACVSMCERVSRMLANAPPGNSPSALILCTNSHAAAFPSQATPSQPVPSQADAPAASGPANTPTAAAAAPNGGMERTSIAAPNARMVAVRVPSFRNLPRLGVQDSMGLGIAEKKNKMTSDTIMQLNRVQADSFEHLTFYLFLVSAGLMDPVFAGMDATTPLIAVSGKSHGQLSKQEVLWNIGQVHLLQIASRAAAEASFKEYFCTSKVPKCAKPGTTLTAPQIAGWGGMLADEFERHAAYKAYMTKDYAATLTWARSAPREAYQVGRFDLGQYDLQKGVFKSHLYLFESDINKNVRGQARLGFVRDPADPVKDSAPHELAMPQTEAQRLVQSFAPIGARQLFAVSKIRLQKADTSTLSTTVTFRATSPKVELFADEALQTKVTEITLR